MYRYNTLQHTATRDDVSGDKRDNVADDTRDEVSHYTRNDDVCGDARDDLSDDKRDDVCHDTRDALSHLPDTIYLMIREMICRKSYLIQPYTNCTMGWLRLVGSLTL